MADIITLDTFRKTSGKTEEPWKEVHTFGSVGGLRVSLIKEPSIDPDATSLALLGGAIIGDVVLATFPDTDEGDQLSTRMGPVILAALEHAQTEFGGNEGGAA